jgi:hypothetical protein
MQNVDAFEKAFEAVVTERYCFVCWHQLIRFI